MIVKKVHARIGLLGNPSDGYFGRTIALSLKNFHAEVVLEPAKSITFIPHSRYDNFEYDSLEGLAVKVNGEGYYGGVRLLMAACKRFYVYCKEHNLPLEQKNFSLRYDTNIPRQTGLSGSSAIICAAMNCLMEYFDVERHIPLVARPALVLSCEEELGITAGLQDRVIQVYGGVVFMDFDKVHMDQHGHGRYEVLDPTLLPPLWLMYSDNPSESGKVHSSVRKRWLEGDADVRGAMAEVAELALQGREALQHHDLAKFATLMNRNFDLRRRMFGDAVLGAANLHMVELARSVGAAAKFCGSGGAIAVYCPAGSSQAEALQAKCRMEGITLLPIEVGPSNTSSTASA